MGKAPEHGRHLGGVGHHQGCGRILEVEQRRHRVSAGGSPEGCGADEQVVLLQSGRFQGFTIAGDPVPARLSMRPGPR